MKKKLALKYSGAVITTFDWAIIFPFSLLYTILYIALSFAKTCFYFKYYKVYYIEGEEIIAWGKKNKNKKKRI